jgi:peptidyl-prolyl cis-trans isomerase D
MVKKIIKNNLKRFFLVVVVVLIVLTLIPYLGFNYNDILNSNSNKTKWITVGNKTVSDTMVLQEYNQSLQQYANEISQNPEILNLVFNNILQKYVTTLIYANEAESIGLTISDKELYKIIATLPQLQNEQGELNRSAFNNVVNSYFGSEKIFLDFMRTSVLQEQLMNSLLSSIQQPSYLAYLDFLAISQTKTIKYITLNNSLIKTPLAKATTEDLQKILQENKDFFLIPEKRDAEIIYIDNKKIDSLVKVSKEDIQEYYTSNLNNYANLEKRNVSQLIFTSKDDAQKAYNNIKNLEIKEILSKNDFINIGDIDINAFSTEKQISKLLFSARPNTILEPVQSSLGWHIFIVLKITPASSKNLATVEKEIYDELFIERKMLIKNDLKKQIKSMLRTSESFKSIALKNNAIFINFNNIDEKFKISDSKITQDIKETIFNTKSNNSDILEDQDGTLYAVKITNINSSTIQTLEQAKNELQKIWDQKQQSLKLQEIKEKIILDISSNKNIDSLGYTVKTTTISRISKETPFNNETQEAILKSQKNIAISGLLNTKESAIAVITNIKNINEPYLIKGSINPKIDQFVKATNSLYINLFLDVYTKALSNKFNVFINNAAIQERFNQASGQ